ncbi:MAG: hypothetical protein J7647_28545 [Cyanobacteria bacterium SBLK]|nr:hypothetical protein [Cyanobacteria bacterium SBLK]
MTFLKREKFFAKLLERSLVWPRESNCLPMRSRYAARIEVAIAFFTKNLGLKPRPLTKWRAAFLVRVL